MSTNLIIWGGIAFFILAAAGVFIYLYKFSWKKAEKLGAAIEKADTVTDSSEVALRNQREMAEAQAQRKTPEEYRDWVKSQGTQGEEKK